VQLDIKEGDVIELRITDEDWETIVIGECGQFRLNENGTTARFEIMERKEKPGVAAKILSVSKVN
jgi:hypothetical protein